MTDRLDGARRRWAAACRRWGGVVGEEWKSGRGQGCPCASAPASIDSLCPSRGPPAPRSRLRPRPLGYGVWSMYTEQSSGGITIHCDVDVFGGADTGEHRQGGEAAGGWPTGGGDSHMTMPVALARLGLAPRPGRHCPCWQDARARLPFSLGSRLLSSSPRNSHSPLSALHLLHPSTRSFALLLPWAARAFLRYTRFLHPELHTSTKRILRP